MTACKKCDATWGGHSVCHCAECHATFTTPSNFDKHRAGKKNGREAGQCYDPTDAGLVLNKAGRWSMPGFHDEVSA